MSPNYPLKPVPGHLGISFAFGAFTVALACQKLLLLRCYLGHQEVISRMESSSRDALANTRLGLHFKWCKYLMPSEVKVTYGKLYARILQKISTMDLLYARTVFLKKPTMDWMVRWQALCKDHVKISTMDGKLYTRTLQKISTMDLLYARTLVKKTLPWIGW